MGLSERVRIRCVRGADVDCLGEVVPTQWERSIVLYICIVCTYASELTMPVTFMETRALGQEEQQEDKQVTGIGSSFIRLYLGEKSPQDWIEILHQLPGPASQASFPFQVP